MAQPEDPEQPGKILQHTRRGLKMVTEEKSLFDLNEPIWHADEKSPICDRCSAPFSFTRRRHHCRRCGLVVCTDCSDKAPLTRMGYVDPTLVCNTCAPTCRSEEEFFQNHLKQLVAGAYFHLSDSPDPGVEYLCKLSSDHNQIIISDGHLPINMKQILEVKTLSTEGDGGAGHEPGRKRSSSSTKNISLELLYKSGGLEQKMILSPSVSHSRKASVEWLRSLKKALILLHSQK